MTNTRRSVKMAPLLVTFCAIAAGGAVVASATAPRVPHTPQDFARPTDEGAAGSPPHRVTAGTFAISSAFGSHMVLQRAPARAAIWGFDAPGTTVTVILDGGAQRLANTTDATGLWRVTLAPVPPGGPHTLTASSSGGGSAALDDVQFGAVFVCGGQSNMQFSLHAALNASAEIADAANHPLIRLFTVGQGGGMSDAAPLRDFTSIAQNWSVASPASVGDGDFTFFSALCYLFARETQTALAHAGAGMIPFGMISANWGGTCLSSWTPADGTAARDCGMTGTSGHANLYNGLIAPLSLGPMAIDGFLFSQGECDADCNNTAYYACAFPRFVEDWRGEFGKAPTEGFFSFQLLPAYVNDSGRFNPFSLPYERAAQLQGLAAGGPIHVANTIDLGDALAPYGSVHPRNKQAVAQRMSAAARALVFGDAAVPYLAPSYASASAQTSAAGDVTVTVTFAPTPPSSGALELRPASCPAGVGGLPASECAWFEIQTADGAWHNATGVALTADSKRLVLTVPGLGAAAVAAATRAFFSPWPVVVLYAADSGLPALPWWEPVQLRR